MARRMQAVLDGNFLTSSPKPTALSPAMPMRRSIATRPAYRFTVENSVYVAPDMQRRGIGKVLSGTDRACTALGFRQMIAVIGDSNQAASIGVHRACGFADAGNLRNIGWKFGRWLDTLMMQLALGEGAATPAKGSARRDPAKPVRLQLTQSASSPPATACRSIAARGRVRDRGARSGRSPRSRCRRPGGATAWDFFRCGRAGLPMRGETQKTRRDLSENRWRNRAIRRRRPCGHRDRECG